jgi:hypothetical protein
MADNIEELNDLLGINNLIEGFIPKTKETIPGMPPAPSYEIPETMDYGGKVTSKEPIKIEAVAKAPQAQPMSELQMPEMARQKPTGLSSDILEELKKYEGLSPNSEDIVSSSTKSYEPLLKDLQGRKKDAGWMDFLTMALPAAIGAAYGQGGVGASLGGEYGLQRAKEIEKRNESIEDAMTRVKGQIAVQQAKKRQTLADKKVEVMGEDGNAYLVPESFAISRGLQAFKEGSFDKVKYVDNTGEQRWAAFDKKRGAYRTSTGDILAEKDTTSMTEQGRNERQKEAQKLRVKQEFQKPTSPFGSLLKENETIVSAGKLLNDAGTIAESGIGALIARGIFREVGVLTDSDIKRTSGDPSLVAQYNRLWGRLMKGDYLEDTDRQDVRVLLEVANNVVKDRMKKQVKAQSSLYPELDVNKDIQAYADTVVEDLPAFKGKVATTRQQNRGLTVGPFYDPQGNLLKKPDGSPRQFVIRTTNGIKSIVREVEE